MRILFLGNANSPLVNNLSRELREYHPDWEIDIVSDRKITIEGYRNSFDEAIGLDESVFYRRIKYLRIIGHAFQCFRAIKSLKHKRYDHVHIFFLYPSYGIIRNTIRRISNSLKVSVFGSEFYRTSGMEKYLEGRIAKRVDQVVASNEQTLDDFCNYYHVPESKRAIRLFGLKSLEFINITENESRALYKKHFDIPESALVVTCGYNGSRIQNHLKILDAIQLGKNNLPANIFLLFPMMMGGDAEYTRQVRTALEKSGFHYLLFDTFMSNEDLGKLRCASDVLIQVQEMDQLAGAMIEHIYAGNALITGKWLPYIFLDKNNIFHYKIDRIENVDKTLRVAMDNLNETMEQRFANRKLIWSVCGWENARKLWSALYTA